VTFFQHADPFKDYKENEADVFEIHLTLQVRAP
jgi:hypothetical protein